MPESTDPPPAAPSAVDVLSHSMPHRLVVGGLLVFFLNMLLARAIAIHSNQSINRPYYDSTPSSFSAAAEALRQAPDASPNTMFLLHRIIEAELHHGLVANKQTLLVVGMAVCFGLMSIGFALYIMGIKGAFSFSVSSGGNASPTPALTLVGTAPGLLCFLLAAVVAVVALTRTFQAHLGSYNVFPDTPPPATQEAPSAIPPSIPDFPYGILELEDESAQPNTKSP